MVVDKPMTKVLPELYEENNEPYIPIYNILYDRSGQLIITADDNGLIKIWSSQNGLLRLKK